KSLLPATGIALPLLLAASVAGRGAETIEYNRDVRPIITENCFKCHGPDKNQRKAKLRLDLPQVPLERGALVPGKPEQSKLIEHIFSDDPAEVMPPPKSNKSLTQAQKELLKQWIASGAKYQAHWAYIEPERPLLPETKSSQWVRNPV